MLSKIDADALIVRDEREEGRAIRLRIGHTADESSKPSNERTRTFLGKLGTEPL